MRARVHSICGKIASSSASPSHETCAVATQSQFILLHFDQTCHEGTKRYACKLCASESKDKFYVNASTDTLKQHLEKNHQDVKIPTTCALRAQKHQREVGETHPITMFFKSPKTDPNMEKAVQMLARHPGLPLSLFSSQAFLAPWTCRVGVSQESVRAAVIDADKERFTQLNSSVLKQMILGVELDGAKNSSGAKNIGEGIVCKLRFYAYDLLHLPDRESWDASFYCDLIAKVIELLESDEDGAPDALVAGVTMDNESSLHAGMRQVVVDVRFRHVIHNRCACHTIELLISDLKNVMPVLERVVDTVMRFVTIVKNNKFYRDALATSQSDAGEARPLVLIKPNNTRKWSTGFLCISRVMRLLPHIQNIRNVLPLGSERRSWIDDIEPLIPSVEELRATQKLLFWIYVAEQVLQRDCASMIHAAACFEEIALLVTDDVTVPPLQKLPACVLVDANVEGIRACVKARADKMKQSGVYNLSVCLWPDQDNRLPFFAAASEELETLVERCWPRWQSKKYVLKGLLLPQFRVSDVTDEQEMIAKKQLFLTALATELAAHAVDPCPRLQLLKTRFKNSAGRILQTLSDSEMVPKRGGLDDGRFKVDDYWTGALPILPNLFLVYKYLSSVPASEAGVERMFSKEGFIHSDLRNLMHHDIVRALLRNAMNSEFFEWHPPLVLE